MISRKTSYDLIIESFRELCSNREAEMVTIQEIVDNCGYSKSTFYKHFRSKEDLICKTFDYFVRSEVIAYAPKNDFAGFLQNRIENFEKMGTYCRNVSGGNDGLNSMMESLVSRNTDSLVLYAQMRPNPVDIDKITMLELEFYSRAIMYSSDQWYKQKWDVSRKDFVNMMLDCMPKRVSAVLLQ